MDVKLIGLTIMCGGAVAPDSFLGPTTLIETAGRVCYRSEKKTSAEKFVLARIKEGHESVIEHASATFIVSGISRACSHQLVRHRIASYSQESQRYVDMSTPKWIVPPSIHDHENTEVQRTFQEVMWTIEKGYKILRELGVRKEDARFLLPNATATRIAVTMNFRELRHFFEVRCDKAAQWEIRELAERMLHIAYVQAPAVFQDLYVKFDMPIKVRGAEYVGLF